MHKACGPELSPGGLEFQLTEVFDYPIKMIAGGMPTVDLLPDDLQVLIAVDEVARVVAHAPEKPGRAQAELEAKSARLRLLRELTNSLAGNQDLNDVLREVTDRTRWLMRSDFGVLGLLDTESGRFHVNAFDLPADMPLDEETVDALAGALLTRVLDTGKPWTGDSGELARVDATTARLWAIAGLERICVLPLMSRGQALGILAVGRREHMAYTADETDFLVQVSGQLAAAIQSAVLHGELQRLKRRFEQERVYPENEIRSELKFPEIIGKSSVLEHVLRQMEVVAPTDSGVLIQGETGTGKELIARAIHNLSARRDMPFIKVNCAALPSGLLESELFGHEKGAFTGAVMRKAGRFELADKGTLFLDEVGDIPLELQPKLLRVLQEHEFERLGATRTQRVDVRVIAATHRDLKQMVEEGQFRSDLYYRLHVFPLSAPALRERREDIPLLVRHYVDKCAKRMNRRIETIPSQAMEVFTTYAWPGNVRELQNFIERAVILSPASVLRAPLEELKEALQESNSRVSTLEEAEREHVLRALRETNWVIAGPNGAAVRLGMKRTTLAYRIRKLKIPCRPE